MKPATWLSIIVLYTIATLLCFYLIPTQSGLLFLRYFFGFTFVVFVPGYCFVNLLFEEGKLDLVETLVLSVASSFSVVGISALFIGLSPIGLEINSIVTSLSGIVIVFAALAFLRKTRVFPQLRVKRADKNSA